MQKPSECLLPGSVFTFNGGELQMRRHDFGLQEQLAPARVHTDQMGRDRCFQLERLGF